MTEYIVVLSVRVTGSKGVHAKSEEEAIEKAMDEWLPTYDADDWEDMVVEHVENYD